MLRDLSWEENPRFLCKLHLLLTVWLWTSHITTVFVPAMQIKPPPCLLTGGCKHKPKPNTKRKEGKT